MSYKVVSSKQHFYADTSNVLNKCLSLPNTGCCRRVSLQYFTQRGSKSPLLSPTPGKQQTYLAGTELLGMVCTIINLHEQPQEKSTKKNNKKGLILCCCLHFICKVKEIATSYQCKMSVNPQGDLKLCRCYHRLLLPQLSILGYCQQSKTPLGEKPKIIITTRKYISI